MRRRVAASPALPCAGQADTLAPMIVFGTRLYGYCDNVEGEFHVATQFFHIWFVPLIPTGSYIVLSEEGNSWRGVKIGFNLKSLLFAWVRAGMILSLLGGLIGGIALLAEGEVLAGVAVLFGALLCGGALFVSYRFLSNASPARAQELIAMLKAQASAGAAPPATPWQPSPSPQAAQPWQPQQAQQPWPPQQAAQQPWPPQQGAQQPWSPQQAPQQQQPWPPQQAAQQPWPPQGAQRPWPPQQAQQQPPQPYPPNDWPRR